jgi:hypothetical protein
MFRFIVLCSFQPPDASIARIRNDKQDCTLELQVFFSEEKKQKTFIYPPLPARRPWPESCRLPGPEKNFVP